MKKISSQWLGLTTYSNALIAQDRRVDMVRMGKDPVVLGCEHRAVITLGRRCEGDLELKTQREKLKSQHIQVLKVHRGGQATLHMPGQLVIYPIIDLKALNIGVKEYVHLLMAVTRNLLANKGVSTAFVTKNPGLYSDKGKICFFGIRVQKGITSHGLSLNVNNDLNLFNHIKSCGKDSENFDSLAERGIDASCQQLFEEWYAEFERAYSELKAPLPQKSEDPNVLPLT